MSSLWERTASVGAALNSQETLSQAEARMVAAARMRQFDALPPQTRVAVAESDRQLAPNDQMREFIGLHESGLPRSRADALVAAKVRQEEGVWREGVVDRQRQAIGLA